MPVLLAFLRGNWQHLLIGALILFGIWKIDQNGYSRAKRQAEAAEQKRVEMERRLNEKISAAARDAVAAIDRNTVDRLGSIDVTERTIVQPTIVKEIQRETRLSDPAAGLTPGLLRAVNEARRASAGDPGTAGQHP